MEKIVTIIVPIYNTPLFFLQRCLNSISSQYIDSFEIILINDKSDDLSVNKFIKSLKNTIFTIFNNCENVGLGQTRNIGMEKALGKFIIFLDSDDYFLDGALTTILDATKMNVDIVSFNSILSNDKESSSYFLYLQNKKIFQGVVSWCKLYSKAFLYEHKQTYLNLKLPHEDNYFFTKNLLANPRLASVDTVIMVYEKNNENSITKNTSEADSAYAMLSYFDILLPEIKKNVDTKLFKDYINQDFGLYFSLFRYHVLLGKMNRNEYKKMSLNNRSISKIFNTYLLRYLYCSFSVFLCINFRWVIKLLYLTICKSKKWFRDKNNH